MYEPKAIGERVRSLRRSQKMTQSELAEKAGICRVFEQYIEAGTRNPSLKTVQKVADALNVDIQSLLLDLSSDKNPDRVQLEDILSRDGLKVYWKSVHLTEKRRVKMIKHIQKLVTLWEKRDAEEE